MSKQAETEATTQAKHYVFKGGKEIIVLFYLMESRIFYLN